MKININMILYKLKNRKYVYLNNAVKTVRKLMGILLAICATVAIPIIYNKVTEKVEKEAMIYSITSLLVIMSFFDYLTNKTH